MTSCSKSILCDRRSYNNIIANDFLIIQLLSDTNQKEMIKFVGTLE